MDKENKKQPKKFTSILLGGLVCILLGLVVLVTITSSTKGSGLIALEGEARRLTEENRELEAKIESFTSLSEIQEKSEELGMIEPENVLYLETDEPLAKLP